MVSPYKVGDKVLVSHIYQWPELTYATDEETVRFQPVSGPHPLLPAVIVGTVRRAETGTVERWEGGSLYDGDSYEAGVRVQPGPKKRTFYAVRYTLRGRRYYTTGEYMRPCVPVATEVR